MGNQQSSAVSQAINMVAAAQPNVTPDPASQCTANKINASNLQKQLDNANSLVDACDPSVPNTRKASQLKDTNQQFVNESRGKTDLLTKIILDKFKLGNDLAGAVEQIKHYEKEIGAELLVVEKDAMKLEHDERKYRRDFIDNQPTDGVPWYIFGLQTSDDKVMLTFWITSIICFSLLTHIALVTLLPSESFKDRAIKGTIAVLIALFICYLLIIYQG